MKKINMLLNIILENKYQNKKYLSLIHQIIIKKSKIIFLKE